MSIKWNSMENHGKTKNGKTLRRFPQEFGILTGLVNSKRGGYHPCLAKGWGSPRTSSMSMFNNNIIKCQSFETKQWALIVAPRSKT
jgi:hypothetical protein